MLNKTKYTKYLDNIGNYIYHFNYQYLAKAIQFRACLVPAQSLFGAAEEAILA